MKKCAVKRRCGASSGVSSRRAKTILALCVLVAALQTAFAFDNLAEVDAAAKALAAEGKYDEAARVYEGAISLASNADERSMLWLSSARQRIAAGDFSRADRSIARVMEAARISARTRAAAMECTALSLEKQGKKDDALKQLTIARQVLANAAKTEQNTSEKQKLAAAAARVTARAQELQGDGQPVQTRTQTSAGAKKDAPAKVVSAPRPASSSSRPAGTASAASGSAPKAPVSGQTSIGKLLYVPPVIKARDSAKAAEPSGNPFMVKDQAALDAALAKVAGASGGEKHKVCMEAATAFKKAGKYAEALEMANLAMKTGVSKVNTVYETAKIYTGGGRTEDGLNFIEYYAVNPKALGLSKGEQIDLLNWYGFLAVLSLAHDRTLEAIELIHKENGELKSYFGDRGPKAVKMFKDLETFPRNPDSIVFPQENIWVKEEKTVHAKDFGWNPDNATACLQKAIDSGATTVIVDKMDGPWYITSVTPASNQTIIFEDGVEVLCEANAARSNPRDMDMFKLRNCRNAAFIGHGKVYIGKYRTHEERLKLCRDYGSSGFSLEGCKNILIRNLKIAECSMDGICAGGLREINNNIYVVDVVLDGNVRQAMSLCNADEFFCKNVTFSNTIGQQPMCGIDLEPSIQEVQAIAGIYLIDCKFEKNRGGDLNFSCSSVYPVSLYAKNCTFQQNIGGNLVIFALCGLYMGNATDAPGHIIIDGCKFTGDPTYSPVRIDNSSLFHVTFKDCEVVEPPTGPGHASPFQIRLNRDYYPYFNWKDNLKEGCINFQNVKIRGYKGVEPLGIVDKTGRYSVRNIYGTISHGGRTVNMEKYSYIAPDLKYQDIEPIEISTLKPPEKAVRATRKDTVADYPVEFSCNRPWYSSKPRYTFFAYGTPGESVRFTLEYDAKAELDAAARLEVTTPSGAKIDKGALKTGSNPVVIDFTEAGYYSFTPPPGYQIRKVSGSDLPFQGAASPERLYQFKAGGQGEWTGYFEVPAGKDECVVKVTDGSATLVRGRDKEIESVSIGETGGSRYFKIKEGPKPQIYGIRISSGRQATFKFYAPLTGIMSGNHDALP